jgi:hypothetical protein
MEKYSTKGILMKILKDSWRLEHYNLMRTYIGSKIGKVLKQELPLANELVASRLEIEVVVG